MKKIITLLLFVSCVVHAQQAKLIKADKEFNSFAYVDAIEVYEKILQNGYQSAELYERLGNSYYLNGQYEKAAQCYKSLIGYNQDLDPEIYFRYSHCLKALGNYEEANKMSSIYYDKTSNSAGKKDLATYLAEIKNNTKDYLIKSTDINTEFSDYGPFYSANKVYFTSAIDTAAVVKKIHDWTGQNFTDIYVANVNKDTTLTYSGNFSKKVNTKFNESSPVFTKDGKTMYFTRNNFLNGKKGKSGDKSTFVKIYKAILVNGEWDNITELSFNNNESSFAHPALSLDEKTMYFASDMAGTNGYSDIYKVKINDDGSFGSPENLGSKINTTGRETFPSVDKDGNLHFASDGHLGLGGLDLFIAKVNKDGSFQEPANLGERINSPMDDFGITFYDKTSGFFTSNRENGKGFDDIYYFKEKICKQKADGIVYDKQTNLPIAAATVILFDEEMKEIEKISSDEKGYYTFNVECGKKYYIRGLKEEYEPAEVKLITNEVHEKVNTNDLYLSKKQVPIDEGTDLAKILNTSKIYFDLDKWNIRPDAEVQLQKIIEVMKQYPDMVIDIRSHTDSRQTHKYNELLSDRRAKSTLEYMVKHKIARNRLSAKGYGETQLVNKCADDVYCTEDEHQLNRRSEFIIVKIK